MRPLKTLKMVREACRGVKVLDLGCGDGQITNYLYNNGFNIKGIDFNKDEIEKAKKRNPKIDFSVGDIEKLNIKGKFDTILLMGVLEYVKNPVKLMKRLKDNLSPGGVVILEVPNVSSIRGRIKCFFGLDPVSHLEMPEMCRVHTFTKSRVRDMIHAANYGILKLTSTKFVSFKNREIPMPLDSFATEFFAVVRPRK